MSITRILLQLHHRFVKIFTKEGKNEVWLRMTLNFAFKEKQCEKIEFFLKRYQNENGKRSFFTYLKKILPNNLILMFPMNLPGAGAEKIQSPPQIFAY